MPNRAPLSIQYNMGVPTAGVGIPPTWRGSSMQPATVAQQLPGASFSAQGTGTFNLSAPGGVQGSPRLSGRQGTMDLNVRTVPVTHALGLLSFIGNVPNGNTVTIGTKTYTFQNTLTNVDGNVKIGALATDSIDNLVAAIVLGTGAGTKYATAMTLHPTVTAANSGGNTMTATAKVGGASGNLIATTVVTAAASWGGTTLAEGGPEKRTICYLTDDLANPSRALVVGIDELNRPFTQITANQMAERATGLLTLTGNLEDFAATGTLTLTGNLIDVAATGVLTLTGNVADVAATGVLTFTGNVADVAATATLTSSGQVTDGDTVTIDGKVYTFQDTLTDVDGNVQVGGTQALSMANLRGAINLDGTAGTDYALSTTLHPTVSATDTATQVIVTAKAKGTEGNSLAVATTGTLLGWSNPTLTGGTTNTVSIGTKTYRFQSVLTNVDGNVLIGATASDSIDNLIAAVVLGVGSGTTYAAATTLHPTVTAAVGAGDTMGVTAKTNGYEGNSIATSAVGGVLGWDDPSLTGGDNDTVTIGGKVYLFQSVLTDVNGQVLIGATASDSIDNLIAAITLGPGAGTLYATSTTLHSTVTAAVGAGDTMGATAKSTGTGGNSITTTTYSATASWGAASLLGGTTNFTTIGGKIYTFQAVLTNVDGHVLIGATASDTIDNLIAAINLGSGSGTLYAALTTLHPTVSAAVGAGDTMVATAKSKGTSGNSITTVVSSAFASWGTGTLLGGAYDTVTIGTKTYRFQSVLTNTDGNVKIGASALATVNNLVAAIMLGVGAGTDYANATTKHTTVTAAVGLGTTMAVTAQYEGASGNLIATTDDAANASWGSPTLTGGIGSPVLTLGEVTPSTAEIDSLSIRIRMAWDSQNPIVGTRHAALLVNGESVPSGDWTTDPVAPWDHFMPTYLVMGFGYYTDADFDGVVLSWQGSEFVTL
jgi:hypothetical protein